MSTILFIAVVILFLELRGVKSTLKSQKEQINKLKKHLVYLHKAYKLSNPFEKSSDVNLSEQLFDSNAINPEPIEKEKLLSSIESKESIDKTDSITESVSFDIDKKIKPKTPFENYLSKVFSVESIIPKLGILLLLIGTGFIFKYSYDIGIITEGVTLIFGILLGFVLMLIGVKVKKKNRIILSQILLGGGIATQFITIYAAYQVYELILSSTAFGSMIIVSIMALLIAVKIDGPPMAIVGITGGLLTPFVVDLNFIGLQGLGLYIFSIALCSMIIYGYKKWQTLLLFTISSVSIVTILLCYKNTFTASESYQFTWLLISLLILFNGVDFVLHLTRKDVHFKKNINPLLFAILPLVTLYQMITVLDIGSDTWSLISVVAAIIYFALFYISNKARGKSLIAQITYGFFSLFTVFAVLLYFNGNIRTLIIIALSLVFYYVHQRDKQTFTRIIGHCIFGLGFLLAIISFSALAIDQNIQFVDVLTNLLIIAFMTIAVVLQKNLFRMIYGVLVYEVFSIFFICVVITQLPNKYEPTSILLVCLSTWIVVLYGLSNKFKLVPKISIPLLSILPVFIKLVLTVSSLINWHYNIYEILATLVMITSIYTVGHDYFKKEKENAALLMKGAAYVVLSLIMLCDLTLLTNHLGYGLILFASIVFVHKSFEPNRTTQIMKLLQKIILVGWLSTFAIYCLFGLGLNGLKFINIGDKLMFLPLIGDVINLVILFYFLKYIVKSLNIRFIMHTVAYLVVTYMHFNYSVDTTGTVTLLWAAYAIGNLTYNIIEVRREQVNISLALIIMVAAKMILVDFSTVNILWKIVTSMIFGVALLVLSYFIQPILSKKD